ncbi:MAG: ribonuclease III [Nitrospiraceae bacterium]|nr:ribonuclease III [Nitrospiraceae bacterium]
MNPEPFSDLNTGYKFKDKELLRQALTHRSYASTLHNERLEFLGDSVLELVLSEYLFGTGMSEAGMSRARAAIVRGSELARAAAGIGLGDFILLGKGEISTGGGKKDSILAGAFEALAGAVYLDGGYEEAKALIMRILKDKLLSVAEEGQLRDPKTELQELCQRLFSQLPAYRLLKEEGLEHRKLFTSAVYISRELYGQGTGKTKKEAETEAAKMALERLKAAPPTRP